MNNGVIRNAKVVLSDRIMENADIIIHNGQIENICLEEDRHGASLLAMTTTNATPCHRERSAAIFSGSSSHNFWTVDAKGDWLIPGLIDLHVHGAGGADTMDATPESMKTISKTLLQQGTVAFLPTTMSSPVDRLQAVLANVVSFNDSKDSGAEILGLHMEGPFISPAYKGAQAENSLFPCEGKNAVDALTGLAKLYPGSIRILTLAVERTDAAELISICREHGIIPSAGHSEATYEQMQIAFSWGVSQVTHAFNAMPPIHHRRPGLLTEALKNPAIRIELIADGVHVHPTIIELALSLKPEPNVLLVSDGTRAVGMPDGQYELGGQMTTVKSGIASLPDGTIAGSAFPLLQGVRTLAQIGFDLPRAVRHASLYPAKLLGVDNKLGSIEPGKQASLVQLGSDLNVKNVWLRGERI